jgi:hypothetical protein
MMNETNNPTDGNLTLLEGETVEVVVDGETVQKLTPRIVQTHAEAAEINVNRSAEQGYVKVGDVVEG